MANEVEELLQAEQAVQDLLKEIQALKQQVGGYDTAKQSLEQVRQSLSNLVEKTSDLTDKMHSVTTTLQKIGTPEILSRIDAINAAITEFSGESAQQVKALRSVALSGVFISAVSLLVSFAILAVLFMR